MKKLLFLFLLLPFLAESQSTLYFRADSSMFYKQGGNHELILMNSTRGTTGVLYNYFNGRTRFEKPVAVPGGFKIGVDTVLVGGSDSAFINVAVLDDSCLTLIRQNGSDTTICFTNGPPVIPTLQQVLDAGSTLSTSETITITGNTLTVAGTTAFGSLYATATTGTAFVGQATGSGTGIIGMSTSGAALNAFKNSSVTNDWGDPIVVQHATSGTATSGMGTGVGLWTELGNGSINQSSRYGSRWTNVGSNFTSELVMMGIRNGGTLENFLRVDTSYGYLHLTDTIATRAYARSVGGGGGGSGTVTSVAAPDVNGFDFTVTNPTTTPSISLTTTIPDERVIFSDGGALTSMADFWVDGNGVVIVGGTTPLPPTDVKFHVLNGANFSNGTSVGGFYTILKANSWDILGIPTFASGTTYAIGHNSGWTAGRMYVGGIERFLMNSTEVVVNDVSEDLDFRVEGNTDANLINADAGTDKVGIGKASPSEKLDVSGNVRFSGALMPNNTAGTSGQVLTSAGAGSPPTWETVQTLTSGTYTPTGTSVANVSGSSIASGWTYTRIGDIVSVTGQVQITPTAGASTATEFGITLPIASDLAGGNELNGVATNPTLPGESASLEADPTNDRAALKFSSQSTTVRVYKVVFTYRIIAP